MKRKLTLAACMTVILVLALGVACAASIQVTNGPVSLDVGEGRKIILESFHILGVYEDGTYLVYANGKLYTVSAEAMEASVVLDLSVVDIPVLEDVKTLAGGSKGRPVTNLQIALRTLGYFSGAANGEFDAKTTASVTAFQEAVGFESTGTADVETQLLALSMAEEPVELEGIPDPEVMYSPILGKTSVDLSGIMESGMRLAYDEFTGEGFISDGSLIQADMGETSELDKAELEIRFGLITRETDGSVEVMPAAKISCLCVRRPVMNSLTVKAGDKRGSAEITDLTVRLDGIYTVEEGICLLTEDMCESLARAAEAGELKIRITGQYGEFDIEARDDVLDGVSMVGTLAGEMK